VATPNWAGAPFDPVPNQHDVPTSSPHGVQVSHLVGSSTPASRLSCSEAETFAKVKWLPRRWRTQA
jgi:hypothetical protein